jgi:hypothetical protein
MHRLKSLAAGPALSALRKAAAFSTLQVRQRGGDIDQRLLNPQ